MVRFPRHLVRVGSVLAAALASTAAGTGAASRVYTIDPSRSRALVAVGKAGALSFAAGHTHEIIAPTIGGVVNLDPADLAHSSVRLTIDVSSLRVTGKGEPTADVPEVQRVMLSDKVLDVDQYGTIVFESTSISVEKAGPAASDVRIAGHLTLHGVTGSLSVPVHVAFTPDGLSVSGRFRVKQTDYGISPVSVGGVVKVKDMLDVDFTIIARARNGG
jgi:polyisoprenoid-binding protein YceI